MTKKVAKRWWRKEISDSKFCDDIGIRVSGIDALEIRGKYQQEKDLAMQAKIFAKDFLSKGKIELKNMSRGKCFRIVADVYVRKKLLAKALIKRGLAVPYDGGTKTVDWCLRKN